MHHTCTACSCVLWEKLELDESLVGRLLNATNPVRSRNPRVVKCTLFSPHMIHGTKPSLFFSLDSSSKLSSVSFRDLCGHSGAIRRFCKKHSLNEGFFVVGKKGYANLPTSARPDPRSSLRMVILNVWLVRRDYWWEIPEFPSTWSILGSDFVRVNNG